MKNLFFNNETGNWEKKRINWFDWGIVAGIVVLWLSVLLSL